ncbi:MAG: Hsp20/alpha crystallin family protein [bacterium]
MAIIRWRPGWPTPFEDWDKWLEEMAHSQISGFMPQVDVYQDKESIIIETPLAGIDPENVDIAVENDVLTISGKSEKKTEVDEKNYYRKEIRSGSFYRSVALPARVLADKATANFDKGMLKIILPKAPQIKSKTIKIKAGKSSTPVKIVTPKKKKK